LFQHINFAFMPYHELSSSVCYSIPRQLKFSWLATKRLTAEGVSFRNPLHREKRRYIVRN